MNFPKRIFTLRVSIWKSLVAGLAFSLIIGSISGCKTKEKITRKDLKNKSANYLFEKLKEHEFQYDWLSAKVNINLKSNKNSSSFSSRLRMRKDSVIWVSITPALGIEAARLYITPDTLKFIDRINKQYFVGSYEMINELLETDVDFEMLEALITGNNFTLYQSDHFEASTGKDHYMLNTVRKRRLKKEFKNIDTVRIILQNIWLNPESFKIDQMSLKDVQSNKKVDATYGNFKDIEGQLMPSELQLNIKTEQNAFVKINFSKVSRNQKQNFPMKIPSKFTPLQFKEK